MKYLHRWPSRVLEIFNRWFSSGAGVWQTFILVSGIVVWEMIHPTMDDHGFWLLFWLTVYSAVTQPVLAYGNCRDTDDTELVLQRIEQLEERIAEKLGINDSTQ